MNCELKRILEGSSHGLLEVLYQNLPKGTGENHENLQSGLPFSFLRFKMSTSKI
jgi:hypothetical protein